MAKASKKQLGLPSVRSESQNTTANAAAPVEASLPNWLRHDHLPRTLLDPARKWFSMRISREVVEAIAVSTLAHAAAMHIMKLRADAEAKSKQWELRGFLQSLNTFLYIGQTNALRACPPAYLCFMSQRLDRSVEASLAAVASQATVPLTEMMIRKVSNGQEGWILRRGPWIDAVELSSKRNSDVIALMSIVPSSEHPPGFEKLSTSQVDLWKRLQHASFTVDDLASQLKTSPEVVRNHIKMIRDHLNNKRAIVHRSGLYFRPDSEPLPGTMRVAPRRNRRFQ